MNQIPNFESSTQLETKWGKNVLENGFVLVPTLLLKKQVELGLDSVEVVVLLNLLASWWDPHTYPYPRTTTIAQRMNISLRTVQRCLKQLEEKGFVARIRDKVGTAERPQLKTSYDLTGTVNALAKVRQAAVAASTQKARRISAGLEERG